MEKLTQNEVKYLENYEDINSLFLRLEAIENDVDLVENEEELEKLQDEAYEVVTELESQLDDWKKRCDLVNYEVKHKVIPKEEYQDLNSFYASLSPSLVGKSL